MIKIFTLFLYIVPRISKIFLDRSKSTSQCFKIAVEYRKIPKIIPGDYLFQRPFLRGLFLGGLTGRNIYIFFLFLLASPKKKQTNRENVGRDTATAVANYSGPGY